TIRAVSSEPYRTISKDTARENMSSTMDGLTLSSAPEDDIIRNFKPQCLSHRPPALASSITSPMKAKRCDWHWQADCGNWQIRPAFHQRMLHLRCRMRSPRWNAPGFFIVRINSFTLKTITLKVTMTF